MAKSASAFNAGLANPHDQETEIRWLPIIFAEEEPEDREEAEPRHLRDPGGREGPRAGRAVLQAPLTLAACGAVITACVIAWAVQGDQTGRVGSHLVLFGLAFGASTGGACGNIGAPTVITLAT